MKISRVNIVTDKEIFFGNVTIENGKFSNIQKLSSKPSTRAKFLLPGFIDSHTHGGYGWDFNQLAKNNFKNIDKYLEGVVSEGVTTIVGTTVTCSKKDLNSISKNWKKFIDKDQNKIVAGWYIEGPFISQEKKGAHDQKLVTPIDLKVLNQIKKQNNFVKILAVAPEVKNNLNLISKISKDYIVSIGHSNCSADIALHAMINGAKRIIHLYNQTSKFDHRNPGIINMAFLDIPIYCELICDGFHVNKLVLKNTYDIVKPDRIIIITDSLSCKGLPNGSYKLGTLNTYKTSEIVRLKSDDTIAGSIKPFNKQVQTFLEATHCNMIELAKMSSLNAAKSIGLDDKIGIIKKGYLADFVIVDSKINIYKTYKNGKLVYENRGI